MPQISGGFARFPHRFPAIALAALSLLAGHHGTAAAQGDGPADQDRSSEAQRIEGAAILDLADAAMDGKPVPTDFAMRWRPDFLKAQQGTFVPFVLTVNAANLPKTSALLYVRAVARGTPPAPRASKPTRADGRAEKGKKAADTPDPQYPVDVIFPVEVQSDGDRPARIIRGFSVPPGEYDVCLVLRERPLPGAKRETALKASVLRQPLSVPNFWTDELTVSSVILADRLTLLTEAPTPDELLERPYAIGLNDVQPAVDARFGKDEELICVFLVYNPKVGPDKTFDVEVEYHFYRRDRPAGGEPAAAPGAHPPERDGETYVNHTQPQRFTAAVMGSQFNPAAGQPIMAGQGVPLAGFREGDYRLMIKVTDFLAGKTLTRDVNFTVGS
jgi:hypothetical protein